jgi:hypothetical protein
MIKHNSSARVTLKMPLAVRDQYERGASTRTVAQLHGIAASTVGEIIAGRHQWTRGMRDIARRPGRPCKHEPGTTTRGRHRCLHAQLAGTAAR